MKCSKYKDKFYSYASGILPLEDKMEMAAHLRRCPTCRQELADIRSASDFFKRHKTVPPLPPDLKFDIMASIDLDRYKIPKPKSFFDTANWGFSMVAAGLLIFILNFTPVNGGLNAVGSQILGDIDVGKKFFSPLTNMYNSANSAVNNIDKLNGITMRMEKAIKGGM